MQLLIVGRPLFRGMAECTCHLEQPPATLSTIFVMNAQLLEVSHTYSTVEQTEYGYSLHQPAEVSCLNLYYIYSELISVRNECGLLTSPVNGHVEMSAGSECGSIADYNCIVGYELRGVVSRVCQVSGVWNGTMPSCERMLNNTNYCTCTYDVGVDCGPLESPINGSVNTSLGTLFMSEAIYYCNNGYFISDARHRTCGAYGQWNRNEPSCIRKLTTTLSVCVG